MKTSWADHGPPVRYRGRPLHLLRPPDSGPAPLQTSDALGAAQVLIGPEALSAQLRKEMGLSDARAARVLDLGWGFVMSCRDFCRSVWPGASRIETDRVRIRPDA
jgi:hypothetical protein